MFLWFGHGCSGHRMQSNMNVLMVWAWVLWSSDAVEHECSYGLGMDALVIGCSRTGTLLWLSMDDMKTHRGRSEKIGADF